MRINEMTSLHPSRSLSPMEVEVTSDLLVFSHLRWNFVFQRPQHLMSRFARDRRVYFVEEPMKSDFSFPSLHIEDRDEGLKIVIPYLPRNLDPREADAALSRLLEELVEDEKILDFTAWYYTPMAYSAARTLQPSLVIYDCMDELSAFRGAPPEMIEWEKKLLEAADLVFTGGQSLYEAKKDKHAEVHALPSSIDVHHFSQARYIRAEPADQMEITGPRLGFFGVIDERLDIELLDRVAALRQDWNLVMLGPVVKISPSDLPQRRNIHYLGMKDYQELPRYLAGWDVAILPFARNESTRFISPTKTPEYLAGGRPVVSTSIRDVVRPYGENGLVEIADTADDFVRAAEVAMKRRTDSIWRASVDTFLSGMSWDLTCDRMRFLERTTRKAKGRFSKFHTAAKQISLDA